MIEPIPLKLPDRSSIELLQARNRQISAVHKICGELSTTLDLDERLEQILTVSMDAVEALAGSILLYRAGDDKLVFRHVVGPNSARLIDFAMKSSDGIAGAVFQAGEGRITNDPRRQEAHRADVSKEKTGFTTERMVTVPLKYQEGRPVGVIQVVNKLNGEFDESDLEVLEIVGSIAATAIQNAQLHREAQLSAVAHAVGDLSHDIKNKVTPIKMAVDTLRPMLDELYDNLDVVADTIPDDRREELSRCSTLLRDFYGESFDIMLEQVQEVQDYTKLIADALKGIITEPELVPNDLIAVVERQMAQLEQPARTAGLRLVRELAEVPPFRFDRFLVERAVYNLINNAIPETPAGGEIRIRADFKTEGAFPDGEYALVEVRDTGRGMPPHVMERILRGDAKSTKPGGTGLGTRIVYNAVTAHKGRLEGESAEGIGTAFRIKLPFRE